MLCGVRVNIFIMSPSRRGRGTTTHLGGQEADKIVEQVDAQAVGDDEPAVEEENPEAVQGHQASEDEPAQARVHGRPVQELLPFPVV